MDSDLIDLPAGKNMHLTAPPQCHGRAAGTNEWVSWAAAGGKKSFVGEALEERVRETVFFTGEGRAGEYYFPWTIVLFCSLDSVKSRRGDGVNY